jgi:alkylation response protein AidB-like acyl-CoA dehydrogenase
MESRCDPADGGQGLPRLLDAALNEMMAAANHGWTMYPGLQHGAYECLRAHGSEALKQRYLARIASGEWLATMNLTEPQAGSDLGLVRTRAQPHPDGSWRITGNKIFISGGEHDLTPNIIHLVLARPPDAPAGTRGLSLFLAPKELPDGTRNALRCDGIEKKMGIKGSATCAMSFEGATGWLVGEPNRGLAAMFLMMNSARLRVALQGLGHLQAAQQNAHDYASERVQGRGRRIAEHPAMRRILWRLRALAEGGRVIAYWAAMLLDQAHAHPDEHARAQADSLVGLLTPVLKSFLTESGHLGATHALQVWGGYGYVHEYGIEQAVRDSRIAMVYEGTNEIQAIDLIQRKVVGDGGAAMARLFDRLETGCESGALRSATASVVAAAARDAELALRVADDYLKGIGHRCLHGPGRAPCRLRLRIGTTRGTGSAPPPRGSGLNGSCRRRPSTGSVSGTSSWTCLSWRARPTDVSRLQIARRSSEMVERLESFRMHLTTPSEYVSLNLLTSHVELKTGWDCSGSADESPKKREIRSTRPCLRLGGGFGVLGEAPDAHAHSGKLTADVRGRLLLAGQRCS